MTGGLLFSSAIRHSGSEKISGFHSSHAIQVIDSHTGGEPTRVVIQGGPDLGAGSVADHCRRFAREFDHYRRAIVEEPRGADILVGALICESDDPDCTLGVIFFNNVGVLGMCGHGTIGLMVTLAHLGRIAPGEHRIETCVGKISATLLDDGTVQVRNVPCYRYRKQVAVDVPDYGTVTGDIAWGGNWFYLVNDHCEALERSNTDRLVHVTSRIRQALAEQGITGENGTEIDHIELFGPPHDSQNHSRNFVLCPGGAFDRSPCGTGTSAKIACLIADGKLAPGGTWRQEGITGSLFTASAEVRGHQVFPTISGTAFLTGESVLLFDHRDTICGLDVKERVCGD